MTSGMTEAARADDQVESDEAWLRAMLPIIRVRDDSSLPLLPKSKEVIALYSDELVLLKSWKSEPIPEAAYEPDGAAALRQIRGKSAVFPIDSIRTVVATPRSIADEYDSLRIYGPGGSTLCRISQPQSPNL